MADYDCVIIGGGLAGLAAADILTEHRQRFVVLEARDRAGGRVCTVEPGSGYLDIGGAYITVTQTYVQNLIVRFGLRTVPTYLPEDKLWKFHTERDGALSLRSDDPTSFPGGEATFEALLLLNRLTSDVRAFLNNPWESPRAAELDALTVADFIGRYAEFHPAGKPMPDATRQAFLVAIRSAFSVEPEDLSLLFMLYYAATTGSFAMLADILGGELSAEGTRFLYGASGMVDGLLGVVGEHVRFGARVTRVEAKKKGCVVHTADGQQIRAKRVITALSPAVAQAIPFDVPASDERAMASRRALHAKMPMGRTMKGFLLFRRPFWRELGYTGNTMACALPIEKYPLDWAIDNCWDPATWDPSRQWPRNRYSLMTFIVGKTAAHWGQLDKAARRDALLRQLAEIYGTAVFDALHTEPGVEDYFEFDLAHDPLSLGGPTGVMGPGVLTTLGPALRAPVGRLHWAGTETATSWCGYMNGALQSGVRAALEVITAEGGA